MKTGNFIRKGFCLIYKVQASGKKVSRDFNFQLQLRNASRKSLKNLCSSRCPANCFSRKQLFFMVIVFNKSTVGKLTR